MAHVFIRQFIGLLIHPKETLTSLKQAPLRSAFAYFFAVWAVFAVLFSVAGWRLNSYSMPIDPWRPIQFAILILAFWLFFGLVVHAFLWIFGGRKSLAETYKAVLYSATPLAAIGWISIIMGLSFIWGLFIVNWGIVEYHEISYTKAFFVLLLSLAVAGFAFAMIFYSLLLTWIFVVH